MEKVCNNEMNPVASGEASQDLQSLRILVVDESKSDFKHTTEMISEITHYQFEIDWANSYDAAIQGFLQKPYDVCMIDHFVGSGNGLELSREMIRRGFKAPIIFVTNSGNHEVDVEAMHSGAADFLVKGEFGSDVLERTIRYAIDHFRTLGTLRESEERYELAIQGARDGLWDWDFATRRVHYSSRWKLMLGYEEHEILDSPEEWFNRVHPKDLKRLELEIDAHLKGAIPCIEVEYRARHKEGQYLWMLTRGLVVRDKNEKPFRMAGSQTDITHHKRAEKALEHLNRKTTRKNRGLQTVIYQTSNDLRNPLVNIQGFSKELAISCEKISSILAKTEDPMKLRNNLKVTLEEDIPEAIKYILGAVSTLDRTVTELLELFQNDNS